MKHKIIYRIYEVSPDGLLKQPQSDGYGRSYDKYHDSDTFEKAAKQIEDEDDYSELTILPFITRDWSR